MALIKSDSEEARRESKITLLINYNIKTEVYTVNVILISYVLYWLYLFIYNWYSYIVRLRGRILEYRLKTGPKLYHFAF